MKHCVASALKDRNLELEDAALVRTCEELAETFSFGADELAMEIERLLFSRCGASVAPRARLAESAETGVRDASLNFAGVWTQAKQCQHCDGGPAGQPEQPTRKGEGQTPKTGDAALQSILMGRVSARHLSQRPPAYRSSHATTEVELAVQQLRS